MTKLGWSILALILLLGAGFASLVSIGSTPPAAAPTPLSDGAPLAPVTGQRLLVPVAGVARAALVDTFGQPRDGGARHHEAIDIMAPRGTPVLAAADGRIDKLFDSAAGGRTIYVRSTDGATMYYYAHLDAYRDGLTEGQVVRRGEPIATVGATGNADAAAPHLHFSVLRTAPDRGWSEGQPVDPFPLLAEPRVNR
ncbi:murein DD-endopeptidase MepM/ murein hydrolase activator NlpD [Sphingomonas sp. BE138]|uniref:M23 family metallopeptidase n=1 Tax=Sphingomonas sp. BE138 TaxID=2817845 RepID=UPI002858D512|nr:M23 family metallopeptidase [Sphingomonas sp. BE138]MDR6789918.1 murein DD-endopeptidase MepM/ murein hydrolase activator NlpD [Sphingomonas sp. BE138]